MDDFKIVGYAFTWKEEEVVPLVIDYWRKVVDHLYVFVFGKTDRTAELLKNYDFVDVIEMDNVMDWFVMQKRSVLMNECWKINKGLTDCAIVSEFSCVPVSQEGYDVREVIKNAFTKYPIISLRKYAVLSDVSKKVEGDEKDFLHQDHVKVIKRIGDMYNIFNPNVIEETFIHGGNLKPDVDLCDVKYGAVNLDFNDFEKQYSLNRRMVGNYYGEKNGSLEELNQRYRVDWGKKSKPFSEIPTEEE